MESLKEKIRWTYENSWYHRDISRLVTVRKSIPTLSHYGCDLENGRPQTAVLGGCGTDLLGSESWKQLRKVCWYVYCRRYVRVNKEGAFECVSDC